jgi:hypothetical protein
MHHALLAISVKKEIKLEILLSILEDCAKSVNTVMWDLVSLEIVTLAKPALPPD